MSIFFGGTTWRPSTKHRSTCVRWLIQAAVGQIAPWQTCWLANRAAWRGANGARWMDYKWTNRMFKRMRLTLMVESSFYASIMHWMISHFFLPLQGFRASTLLAFVGFALAVAFALLLAAAAVPLFDFLLTTILARLGLLLLGLLLSNLPSLLF